MLAVLIGAAPPAGAVPPGPIGAPAGLRAGEAPRSVTLITGDRITLAGPGQVGIERGKGRAHITFLTRMFKGHVTVLPSDALPLVRAGRVDSRLFDVTALIEAGYDDRRPDTPLIVTPTATARARGVAGRPAVPDGVRVVKDLPGNRGLVARADRKNTVAAWNAILARGTGADVPTVWLDGMRKPKLDVSVPQIGAPTAWAAGFDGTGVTVAVADSGIDATHPDLVGQVVAARNFVADEEDAADRVGHGTHVASTIAGTGAASGGKFKGVAPGAKLIDAKVCLEFGCTESAIIAGLQWAAAEQHAAVVNISLGGVDTPEIDPVEQAVQDLSAQYGTLFVIAAGNDGADRSVGSPGSADAALTVGAVDGDDALAVFSSRGPRVGDSALKPDITAPGVGIDAARSKDADLGPGSGPYVSASGTSMATPHVAGAAAILAQRRPGWTGQQLKAAIMASAKPNPAIGIFGQGAGRVDVARAITELVTTEPASVSYGRQMWPHADDTPVTKTVTYRNAGTAAVTLALTLRSDAPAGTFTVSANQITVPAGGTAAVTVTANTSLAGPDGFLGGYLVATAGGSVTSTPLAVEKEVESYDVTLTHLNRAGQPAAAYSTVLINVDTAEYVFVNPDEDGVNTVRVPKGRYFVNAFVEEDDGTDTTRPTLSIVNHALFDLRADARMTLDARAAQPVSVRIPRAGASQVLGNALFGVQTPLGQFVFGAFVETFDKLFMGSADPAATNPGLVTKIGGQWAKVNAGGDPLDSPYTYSVDWAERGKAVIGFHRTVRERDLAAVTVKTLGQARGARGARLAFGSYSDIMFGGSVSFAFRLPATRTEYYNAQPGHWWETLFDDELAPTEPDGFPTTMATYQSERLTYRPGHAYQETWNKGMFGPAMPDVSGDQPGAGFARRLGDQILWDVPMFGDGFGRMGFSRVDSGRTTMYVDGTKVGEAAFDEFPLFEVPNAAGRFKVESTVDRTTMFPYSTKVSATWTFRSGHVDGEVPLQLPISVVRFTPTLDDAGTAPAGCSFTIPVNVQRQGGSAATASRSLSVEVSYDDGATWKKVTLERRHGGYVATVQHPKRAGYVSLRAKSTDTAGNTVDQTIIRAYRIR